MKYYHSGLVKNLNQIAGSTYNLVWGFKKMRVSVRGKKTSSRSWPYELDEERSLIEISCSLWHTEATVTNYFDLVDISTWLWSKYSQYMLLVWVSFKFKLLFLGHVSFSTWKISCGKLCFVPLPSAHRTLLFDPSMLALPITVKQNS